MAITYVGTGGLFTILGQIFGAHESLNTVRTTTIKNQIQQAVDAYKLKTNADLEFDRAINAAANAERSWRSAGDSLASALARDASGLVIEVVKADSDQTALTNLADALQYLIDEMTADGYYIGTNIVTATYVASGGNSSTDMATFAWVFDHLTRRLNTSLAEAIEVKCTAGGLALEQSALATLRFRGERIARNKLSEEFPAGSGIDRTLRPLTAADSLLLNPGFEDATLFGTVNIPDDWIIGVGTPGTQIVLTSYEKQTITISGTPTAGTYQVKLTDPITGLVHATESLAYNASADTLQTALRAITGLAIDLAEVTVTATGTTPNFTHTVEFVGVAGNLAAMTIVNNTTAGSFAIAEVTAGDNKAIIGRGLKFTAHASVLQSIYQRVTLDPDKVYFLGYWITPSTTPTQGVLSAKISDEIVPASSIADHSGGAIGDSVDLTLVTAKTGRGLFFSIPPDTGSPLYVCFEKSTAEPTADIVIDEVVLVEATQLYAGGPYVAVMQGKTPVKKDDLWTLTIANDYFSKFGQYFDAFFDMAGKRLLLPNAGSTQISESLVA